MLRQLGNTPYPYPAFSLLTKVAQIILSIMAPTWRAAGLTSYAPTGWGFQGSEEADMYVSHRSTEIVHVSVCKVSVWVCRCVDVCVDVSGV